jgi:hypothetical protein
MYSQTNPAWGDLQLGTSGLPCKFFGCTVTAVAEALTDAGYIVTPDTLIIDLNNIGGFTSDGLLIWAKVSQLYPAFHFGGEGYRFVQGMWGKFQHWILQKPDGSYVDPYYGTDHAPEGFIANGVVRTASIDVLQAPEPAPEVSPAPEVAATPAPFQYVVKSGDTLSEIVAEHYGLSNWPDIKAKYTEVAGLNNIPDVNLIQSGQTINLP